MALSKAEVEQLQAEAKAWVKQAMGSPWFWVLVVAVYAAGFIGGAIFV